MTRPRGEDLGATRKALRDARLEWSEVKGVVMVGGATRMPHVQQAVAELFGQARSIISMRTRWSRSAPRSRPTFSPATRLRGRLAAARCYSLSLGIETMGGLGKKSSRNSTIPVARAQEFTTYKDGQTAMSLHVVQGERELVSDCRSLARFELRGIPPWSPAPRASASPSRWTRTACSRSRRGSHHRRRGGDRGQAVLWTR